MPEGRYRAVLLDFDGTYADTALDMIAALNAVRAEHAQTPVPIDTARPFVSHGATALVNLGFPGSTPAEKARHITAFLAAYARNVAEHTTLYDGMAQWIAALEKAGVRWGIVTNKPEGLTHNVFATLAPVHPPHCVVAGDTLIKRKPHPMPALHAAALLRVPAHQCLFVGDAPADVLAGQSAGMHTVVAGYGYVRPFDNPVDWHADAVVDSVAALAAYTEPLLGLTSTL
ncbi:MAG: HAD-IA family hydrolase [Pseudomonadota bacterium]